MYCLSLFFFFLSYFKDLIVIVEQGNEHNPMESFKYESSFQSIFSSGDGASWRQLSHTPLANDIE